MSAPVGIPFLRRLHVRITLVVLLLLALMGATLLGLARHYSMQSALEATQRLNLDLAQYIVEHQPRSLIAADGEPESELMQTMATQVMMINPAVEVYLLDAQARVIGHALDESVPLGLRVDPGPIRALVGLGRAAPKLPLFGDDPRRPGQANIISVASITRDDAVAGYLYVVLQGRDTQTLTASLASSDTLRQIVAGVALALVLSGLVLAVALRKLTRPLRQLTAQVQAFRATGQADSVPPGGDEITLLRDAAEALQQRVADQFAQIEDNERTRRELISNISHDLHTPLASIQGYVETLILRGDQLDAATREQHLRTVMRHATRLGARVSDLFELSKLESGRIEPRCEVFCLSELLQDVIQSYQLNAQQSGVSLCLSDVSHRKAEVIADIALIERVLQNLIDNALHHTPRGGTISVGVTAEGAQYRVSVSDTGVGIAQENLPHIFERYWRATDASETTPGPSAGLGLAIVKRILDLHGSAMRVQSELQHGTCIDFALPQAG